MSPTRSAVASAGATVQSCPDSILPDMELPRGRNDTVSPLRSLSMWPVAHPMNRSRAFCPSHFTAAPTGRQGTTAYNRVVVEFAALQAKGCATLKVLSDCFSFQPLHTLRRTR